MYTKNAENLKEYDLYNGYSIQEADWKDFAKYFAVYEIFEGNIWFRQSFDIYCSVLKDCDICFWIKKNDIRIGGVLLEPNYMNCLFLEPPYNEYDIIIDKLKILLLELSDENQPIYVGAVKPDKVKYYIDAGFEIVEATKCMIRPTEKFNVIWDDEYEIVQLNEKNKNHIAELFTEAFDQNINEDEYKIKYEKHSKNVEFYFDDNKNNHHLAMEASTLVYEKATNELVGACLISIWEDWPNVYDVAVKPSFQNKGLAKNMLKKALTVLEQQYPVLRIFVTVGNDAEIAYDKLGFLAGIETTEMILSIV